MTICVSAIHFPGYNHPEVATSLSFVLLPYIPYSYITDVHIPSNMLFNFCLFLFLKEMFLIFHYLAWHAVDFFCKYYLLG